MKLLNLTGNARTIALTVVLAFTAIFPLYAQNNANINGRNDERRTDRTETTKVVNQDNDTDWGWLGLLGLLGLVGLLPKKRSIEVKGVRDTTVNNTVS